MQTGTGRVCASCDWERCVAFFSRHSHIRLRVLLSSLRFSLFQVPGDIPSLGYSLDRKERFTDDLFEKIKEAKIYKYRKGPQPAELGGQRALDFVLDNKTLQPFNRTLLFDIKLLAVRRR
jgi:hypothetical protein